MKKAYLTLVKNALAKNLTVSVWDTEEWQIKRSTSYQDIKDAIESVDISELRLRNKAGDVMGWALIVLDCAPDETVADYTGSPLMAELCNDVYTIRPDSLNDY